MENILSVSSPVFEKFILFLPKLITSMVFFVLSLYFSSMSSKGIKRALQRKEVDPELSLLFVRAVKLTIVIIGTVIALQQVGFDLTAFVAGLGIVGFTLGFALQDVSKNLVAGVLLLLQQPFDIGDTVEVGGYTGVVTNINLRATEIQTYDGVIVLIPNTVVYSKPVRNFNRIDRCCIELVLEVPYGLDMIMMETVIKKTICDLPGTIQKDPVPRVTFNKFKQDSIELLAHYWIDIIDSGQITSMNDYVSKLDVVLSNNGISANIRVIGIDET